MLTCYVAKRPPHPPRLHARFATVMTHRTHLLLLLLLLLQHPLSPGVRGQQTNLLLNPGFELEPALSETPMPGWLARNASTYAPTLALDGFAAADGFLVARLDGGPDALLSQRVTGVFSGNVVTFSAVLLARAAVAVELQAGDALTVLAVLTVTAPGPFSVTGTMPSIDADSITVVISAPVASGVVFLDSTSLVTDGSAQTTPPLLPSCVDVGCGSGLVGVCFCDESCLEFDDCCRQFYDLCMPTTTAVVFSSTTVTMASTASPTTIMSPPTTTTTAITPTTIMTSATTPTTMTAATSTVTPTTTAATTPTATATTTPTTTTAAASTPATTATMATTTTTTTSSPTTPTPTTATTTASTTTTTTTTTMTMPVTVPATTTFQTTTIATVTTPPPTTTKTTTTKTTISTSVTSSTTSAPSTATISTTESTSSTYTSTATTHPVTEPPLNFGVSSGGGNGGMIVVGVVVGLFVTLLGIGAVLYLRRVRNQQRSETVVFGPVTAGDDGPLSHARLGAAARTNRVSFAYEEPSFHTLWDNGMFPPALASTGGADFEVLQPTSKPIELMQTRTPRRLPVLPVQDVSIV